MCVRVFTFLPCLPSGLLDNSKSIVLIPQTPPSLPKSTECAQTPPRSWTSGDSSGEAVRAASRHCDLTQGNFHFSFQGVLLLGEATVNV